METFFNLKKSANLIKTEQKLTFMNFNLFNTPIHKNNPLTKLSCLYHFLSSNIFRGHILTTYPIIGEGVNFVVAS